MCLFSKLQKGFLLKDLTCRHIQLCGKSTARKGTAFITGEMQLFMFFSMATPGKVWEGRKQNRDKLVVKLGTTKNLSDD